MKTDEKGEKPVVTMKTNSVIAEMLVRTLMRLSVTISLCGLVVVGPIAGTSLLTARPSQAQPSQAQPSRAPESKLNQRTSYEIDLTINFDARSYSGSEKVRWINRSEHPVSVLYFHLYSNLRLDRQLAPTRRPVRRASQKLMSLESRSPRLEQ